MSAATLFHYHHQTTKATQPWRLKLLSPLHWLALALRQRRCSSSGIKVYIRLKTSALSHRGKWQTSSSTRATTARQQHCQQEAQQPTLGEEDEEEEEQLQQLLRHSLPLQLTSLFSL
jgi:hypothetical protein